MFAVFSFRVTALALCPSLCALTLIATNLDQQPHHPAQGGLILSGNHDGLPRLLPGVIPGAKPLGVILLLLRRCVQVLAAFSAPCLPGCSSRQRGLGFRSEPAPSAAGRDVPPLHIGHTLSESWITMKRSTFWPLCSAAGGPRLHEHSHALVLCLFLFVICV